MKTNYKTILVLFFIISLSGCDNQKKASDYNNPIYAHEIEQRIDRVINNLQVETAFDEQYESKTLSEQMDYYHTPGISIAVINEGEIEWARGFGIRDLTINDSVDINTLFQAASISKPIFALTVMRLNEKGKLSLDVDVNEYLQSWKVPNTGNWQPEVSLRQLLSHTAGMTIHGFPGYSSIETVPGVQQILDGEYPANTKEVKVVVLPGLDFKYCGGGYTVAQLAVEELMNKSLSEISNEELFKPLGLELSTYKQPLPEHLRSNASIAYPYKKQPVQGNYHTYPELAAAGLWTNPTELSRILIEVQRAVSGKSELFKKESIEEMLTPQEVASFMGIGFFLGSQGDSLRFGHGGWNKGFVSQVTCYKTVGKGAVIMVNSNEGNPLLSEIMRSIAIEYNWPDYMSLPVKYIESDMSELEDIVGVYTDENDNNIELIAENNTLYFKYQNQDPIQMYKIESGGYKNQFLNTEIKIEDDNLVLTQRNNSIIYKKNRIID